MDFIAENYEEKNEAVAPIQDTVMAETEPVQEAAPEPTSELIQEGRAPMPEEVVAQLEEIKKAAEEPAVEVPVEPVVEPTPEPPVEAPMVLEIVAPEVPVEAVPEPPSDEMELDIPAALQPFIQRLADVQNEAAEEVLQLTKKVKRCEREIVLLKEKIDEMGNEYRVTRDMTLELRGQIARGKKAGLTPVESWEFLNAEITAGAARKRKARNE